MNDLQTSPVDAAPSPARRARPGGVLGLFSSIWLGVVLLTLLFVYSSVGSAGIMFPGDWGLSDGRGWVHDVSWMIPWTQVHLRQAPGLEMTEFEWFHWWPFDLLIGLICTNIIVATLTRIPFRPMNYGVWMIHTGILMLAAGSVIYFSLKIEGDAPVIRRQVTATVPGFAPVTMPAIPGNRAVVGEGANAYLLEVWSIDPQWELLSGEDKGKRAFSVTLSVQSAQQAFMRQLVADHPQYTEDLIRTDNPQQPMQRARKVNEDGDPLVDHNLTLALEYDPQPYVYLANNISKSWALYLRERGTGEWSQRPVHDLPLYNDYLARHDDAWLSAADHDLPLRPLDLRVRPSSEADPLPAADLRITSYLRHAFLESRRMPGGDAFNPAASVRLENEMGTTRTYDLLALDPARAAAEEGRLQFVWADSAEARDALAEFRPRVLKVTIPGTDIDLEAPIESTSLSDPELPFTPVAGTPYAWRVQAVQDNLNISGRTFSLAMVEIRRDDETFLRWVFDDPSLSRDLPLEDAAPGHEQVRPRDEGIVMSYDPGVRPAPVLVVAGPGPEELGVQLTVAGRPPVLHPVEVGEALPVDRGITLTVTRYASRTREESKPAIVPRAQRDRDAREQFSMVQVTVPTGAGEQTVWVPYHHYAFRDPNESLRRFAYRPAVVRMDDGREIELILSRQRQRLPSPVVLEDFQFQTHLGGFTGSTLSILNWTSSIRFAEGDGTWSDVLNVSVNDPAEHDGYWYFQAQWDPPMGPRAAGDRPSAGLNYTVLGVGNRHGVLVQLLGSIIAVIGMLYAFYVKPIIRRRRQLGMRRELAEASAVAAASPPTAPEPVLAGARREELP